MSLTWLKEKEEKRKAQEQEYKDTLEKIPEVKPKEKVPEPIKDDVNESIKSLHQVIAESNKRQEEILKAIQELKKTDKTVHEDINKTPEQIEAEKLLNKEK